MSQQIIIFYEIDENLMQNKSMTTVLSAKV